MTTTTPEGGTADRPGLPKSLSPSRMSDWKKCPKAFHFKSILRVPTKPTEAQIKGTLVHAVLEHLFDRPRPERTVEVAHSLVPGCWDELRAEAQYAELIASLDEAAFLAEVERLVANYFAMENPQNFDPDGREMWVRGTVEEMPLIGVIDRLDSHVLPDGTQKVFISDYKTGKLPRERYRDDAFFAMRVYALMRHQAGERSDRLRLVYLKEGSREAVLRFEVDEKVLQRTEREVAKIVNEIRAAHAVDEWPTKTGPLCGWCDYKELCPEFAHSAPPPAHERECPW